MNRRIQQFLDAENLTPAKLADIMGIQRSGMSHILSARNKPSYDFILTLLTKFPSLSADWLITGKGKMYRQQTVEEKPSPMGDLFAAPAAETPAPLPQTSATVEDFPDDDFPSDENQEAQAPAQNSVQADKENPLPKVSLEVTGPKRITRITVFYSDGTYEER